MSTSSYATEETKNAIENAVNWFLADKLQDPATTIATKKYLTNENKLIYITHCNVAELSVPRIKVQLFERVEGGVRELAYQIFSDHRMNKVVNEMIFGNKSGTADGNSSEEVSQEEAAALSAEVNALAQARQTL
ncbi:MAG: hypothetical protein NVSMB39_0150 [Candidatus Saccharimonadales bacterium]